MGALKERAEENGLAPAGGRSIADVLKSQWGKIEAVMPKHMSSERLFQMAVSTINHDPKLGQCDIVTILSCLMKCSALGLEPSSVDGLGRAYILPFNNKKTKRMEATFILGYKGMLDLARRSGEIADISARAVYEGDEFDYEFGLDERCRHVPKAEKRTPDTLTHVYAVCHFKDGGHYLEVMTKAEVEAIRKRSKAKDSGPWVTDYEAMAKKTVVRRAFPYLPVSVEAQMGAASDETSGGYEGTIPRLDMGTLEAQPEAPEAPDADSPDEEPEKAEAAPEIEPGVPRRAVCRSCGNVYELEDGQDAKDVRFVCCPNPDYAEES